MKFSSLFESSNNLEKIVVSKAKNPEGYEIFYDRKEGKFYNKTTDTYLSMRELKTYGLTERLNNDSIDESFSPKFNDSKRTDESYLKDGGLIKTKFGNLKVKIKNGNGYLPKNFERSAEFIMKTLGVEHATIISNHNSSDSNNSYGSIFIDSGAYGIFVDWVWDFDENKLELTNEFNKSLNFKKKVSKSFK